MTPSRPTDKTAAGWLVFGIEPGRWRIQVCRAERCGPESDLFVIEQGGLATIPIDWPAAE